MKASYLIAAGVTAASLLAPWSPVAAKNDQTNVKKYAYELHECIEDGGPKGSVIRCGWSLFPYMGVAEQISAKELNSAEFVQKITDVIRALESDTRTGGTDSDNVGAGSLQNNATQILRSTFVNEAERQRLIGKSETYDAIAVTGIGLPGQSGNSLSTGLKWVIATGGQIPDNAINARGKEEPGLVICRAPESGELKTGWMENGKCKVHAYEAGIIDVYEILTGDPNTVAWQQNYQGENMPKGVYLSTEYFGGKYFICRSKNHKFDGDKYLGYGSYYPGTLKISPDIEYASCQAHPVEKKGVGGSHFEVMILKNPEEKLEPEILWDW